MYDVLKKSDMGWRFVQAFQIYMGQYGPCPQSKVLGWSYKNVLFKPANEFKREMTNRFQRTFYTLTFVHTFAHDADQQFFAHCFPYTYSDLQDDLTRIEKDVSSVNFFHRSTLTRTLAGNRCEYLTIDDNHCEHL